ncbi:MAG: hypothetical protein A2002_02990 [Pseudomonadales bacterium GWC1_66_9]|nr:MAG: hypothetical protein A2002_02990 [Pseudomonadales bacterium GWC1_66_9]
MKAFDENREFYRVEPICKVLSIAPSTYRQHAARRTEPSWLSLCVQREGHLRRHIQRVWEESFQVYGARKVWQQLRREGIAVARCMVERLMRRMGLQGVVRGKPVKTTISDKTTSCPLDRVNQSNSGPSARTRCGCRTLLMSPPGRASST